MIAANKKYLVETRIIVHHPGYPYMLCKAMLIVP